jgi:hypothetical protein
MDGAKIERENEPQQAAPEQISSVDPYEHSHVPDTQLSGATTESSVAEASNLMYVFTHLFYNNIILKS